MKWKPLNCFKTMLKSVPNTNLTKSKCHQISNTPWNLQLLGFWKFFQYFQIPNVIAWSSSINFLVSWRIFWKFFGMLIGSSVRSLPAVLFSHNSNLRNSSVSPSVFLFVCPSSSCLNSSISPLCLSLYLLAISLVYVRPSGLAPSLSSSC